MAVTPGFRIGAIVVLAALAAVLSAVLLGSPSSDADYRPPRVDQSRMVLRLPDLPPGYGNGYLGEVAETTASSVKPSAARPTDPTRWRGSRARTVPRAASPPTSAASRSLDRSRSRRLFSAA